MADSAIWQVTLYVDGPVTVRRRVHTTQQKGFREDDPFYSDIEIQSVPSGLRAVVTTRAADQTLAFKAAVFFFGRMLDALTLTVNRPMYLSLPEQERSRIERHDVRRVVEQEEIQDAFREAYHLAHSSPSFLRSLGWYRKGLTADDPLDKFLAFWNGIEIVASRYFRYVPAVDQERAEKGSKSQVWECFKALWGPCQDWPVIAGLTTWIDDSYSVRIDVAHGRAFVDVHKLADVANRLPAIERVCYRFLRGWRDQFLDMDRHPPSESLTDSGEALLFE
jgi:hypothetical protein